MSEVRWFPSLFHGIGGSLFLFLSLFSHILIIFRKQSRGRWKAWGPDIPACLLVRWLDGWMGLGWVGSGWDGMACSCILGEAVDISWETNVMVFDIHSSSSSLLICGSIRFDGRYGGVK
jgi:hypothetical protein